MKIGDYVRTKEGGIINIQVLRKVKDLEFVPFPITNEFIEINYKYMNKKDIINSSPNIIDLIEEQDLIRYRISGDEYVGEVKGHPEFDKYVLHIEYLDTIIDLKDLDIVSIVTREMFESMEYKVGE